jgi:hypothetical protein
MRPLRTAVWAWTGRRPITTPKKFAKRMALRKGVVNVANVGMQLYNQMDGIPIVLDSGARLSTI